MIRNTKKRLWLIEFLQQLGLEVIDYQPQLSSKSHVKIKVKPIWYPNSKPQTLRVFIDPGYRINFKFSKYLDNSFRDETRCMIASLLMHEAEEFCGPDVQVSWMPYHKASPRGSANRPDSCYLRLVCGYLPWKGSPKLISFYNLKCR